MHCFWFGKKCSICDACIVHELKQCFCDWWYLFEVLHWLSDFGSLHFVWPKLAQMCSLPCSDYRGASLWLTSTCNADTPGVPSSTKCSSLKLKLPTASWQSWDRLIVDLTLVFICGVCSLFCTVLLTLKKKSTLLCNVILDQYWCCLQMLRSHSGKARMRAVFLVNSCPV